MDVRIVGTARGPVEVATTGTGPPVIVLHGTPGSWRQAAPLAADLAHAHTVLLPSRPGYGRTPVSSGRGADAQADLFAALLDALGLDRAAVVGLSGGGPSALAFAQRFPARTKALVLCCAVAPHLLDVPRAMRLATLPLLPAVGMAMLRTADRMVLRSKTGAVRRVDNGVTPDELARMRDDPRIREDLVALAWSHHLAPMGIHGLRDDVRGFCASVPQPADAVTSRTLVLHGTHDRLVPLAHAQHHASAIADAVLETYELAGHGFVLTRRREVSPRIGAWLAG